MNCPNCNTAVKDGMRFCPKCGTKIESASFCSKCGKALEPNAAFCMYCGTPVKPLNSSYGVIGVSSPTLNSGDVKTLVCPHCGANATNTQNCEYCGSLLIRFADKGIDISHTSYLSDCKYPGLVAELKKNLMLQAEQTDKVCTDITWMTPDELNAITIGKSGMFHWSDGTLTGLGDKSGGLTIVLDFHTYSNPSYFDLNRNDMLRFNRNTENLLQRFKNIKSYPLFSSHFSSCTNWQGYSMSGLEYAIDFGKDVEGAAALVSEILSQVYNLYPTDNFNICTNVGDNIEQSRNAMNAAYENGSYQDGNENRLFGNWNGDEGQLIMWGVVLTAIVFFIMWLFI